MADRSFVVSAAMLLTVFFVLTPSALALESHLDDDTLRQLAHIEYEMREEMTSRLLADLSLTEDDLARLYTKATVPEQKNRLLAVARHYEVREMTHVKVDGQGKGAVGVRHEAVVAGRLPGVEHAGVMVVKTFPGFPAYAHLQPGDVIIEIDGQPFPADGDNVQLIEHFVSAVQVHKPDAMVRLTVLRNRKKLDVKFRLASYEALQAIYQNGGQMRQPFLAAWQSTRDRLVALDGKSGLPTQTDSVSPREPQPTSTAQPQVEPLPEGP